MNANCIFKSRANDIIKIPCMIRLDVAENIWSILKISSVAVLSGRKKVEARKEATNLIKGTGAKSSLMQVHAIAMT